MIHTVPEPIPSSLRKLVLSALVLFGFLTWLPGSSFTEGTYQALGGNPATDTFSQAITVLKDPIELSKQHRYRAVVRLGRGSATWIGNDSAKSYFITVAHVAQAATQRITTYDGTVIEPVLGSTFHTAETDFGLLVYNKVLAPALFGNASAIVMDMNLVENFKGAETTLVGYGILTIGSRGLGSTRCLSRAKITLENNKRTRSTPDPATQPWAGSATAGDSGGGVFLSLNDTQVLIGANSSGNSSYFNYANIFEHKALINSIVPKGVFSWYSETLLPSISTQPENSVVTVGATATFTVGANGTAPLTYQWKKGATSVGADSATLTISNVQTTDAGSYTCVVSNSAGRVVSNAAILTVNTLNTTPTITIQPESTTVKVSATATFRVVATGSPAPSYQWRRAGTDIPNATGSSYTTPATVIGDNGALFSVVVTNSAGTVISNDATLTVKTDINGESSGSSGGKSGGSCGLGAVTAALFMLLTVMVSRKP